MHKCTLVYMYTHACMHMNNQSCVHIHTIGGPCISYQVLQEEAKPSTDKYVLHPGQSLARHIHFEKGSQ